MRECSMCSFSNGTTACGSSVTRSRLLFVSPDEYFVPCAKFTSLTRGCKHSSNRKPLPYDRSVISGVVPLRGTRRCLTSSGASRTETENGSSRASNHEVQTGVSAPRQTSSIQGSGSRRTSRYKQQSTQRLSPRSSGDTIVDGEARQQCVSLLLRLSSRSIHRRVVGY